MMMPNFAAQKENGHPRVGALPDMSLQSILDFSRNNRFT